GKAATKQRPPLQETPGKKDWSVELCSDLMDQEGSDESAPPQVHAEGATSTAATAATASEEPEEVLGQGEQAGDASASDSGTANAGLVDAEGDERNATPTTAKGPGGTTAEFPNT
ncbi:unnamed protein product, partial [Chrysoparadoxa australica]